MNLDPRKTIGMLELIEEVGADVRLLHAQLRDNLTILPKAYIQPAVENALFPQVL